LTASFGVYRCQPLLKSGLVFSTFFNALIAAKTNKYENSLQVVICAHPIRLVNNHDAWVSTSCKENQSLKEKRLPQKGSLFH
jgi:hypothetical protein